MHTLRNALAAPLLLPRILLAATPAHEWRADLATREVANLYPRHGETAAIRCALTRAGAPYVPESVSASVSTNGVWGDGWPAPATSASNVVTVSWSPELDPGAETLCLRIHVDGIHRPAALLHLGPGGGGSTLPPPGTVIDFAATRYVNEPWATRTELREATNALVIAAVDLAPYATWQGLDARLFELDAAIRSDVETRLSGAVQDLDARLAELDLAIRSDVETRLSGAVDALSARLAAVYTQTLSDNVQTEAALRESIGGVENHDIVQDGRLDALADRDDALSVRIDALFSAPLWRHDLPDSLTLPPGAVRPEMPLRFSVAADGTTPAEILDLHGLRVATVSAGADGIAVVSADFSGAPELSPGTVVARRVAYMDEAGAELAAIRAAADAIELPADPTAAELGAAFRDLLLCIRNPVQARAALRARPAPETDR